MTSTITEELKEMIIPHLKEHMSDTTMWQYFDDMFSEVVYTQPAGIPLVALKPPLEDEGISMQFSCIDGDFVEITDWEYIQTVDVAAQTAEREARELVETISSVLKHYHKVEYQVMTDYEKVISNRTTLAVDNTTVYKYDCPMQTIYLNGQHYPITYGNQRVDEDYYYYNFNDPNMTSDDVDFYTYKVKYEWKRDNVWD